MAPELKPFLRFLFSHALGAWSCFLVGLALPNLTPGEKIVAVLLLVGAFAIAKLRAGKDERVRDGLVATTCGPVAVLCVAMPLLSEYGACPGPLAFFMAGFLAWSLNAVRLAWKGHYWAGMLTTVWLLLVLVPFALSLGALVAE